MRTLSRFFTLVCSTAYFSAASMAALGDDTEIFFTDRKATVSPNIMLLLDASGSMGDNRVDINGDGIFSDDEPTRLEVMKNVTSSLVSSLEDVNVGLMVFGGEDGAYFKAPVAPIGGQRESIRTKIDQLTAGGFTPLSESLFQAMRYYQGEEVFIRSTDKGDPAVTVDGVASNGDFISPIKFSCQPNYAVLLTDGEPTRDSNDPYHETIESVVGACSGNCLDEIAGYMYTSDLLPDSAETAKISRGQQKVSTYTVGFDLDLALLREAASKGGGQFLRADNASELTAALTKVFDEVRARSSTYVAPGIAVNTFDRLNHLNMLYYALFQSDKGAIWNGNLKRYKLDIKEDDNGEPQAVIVDVNGNEAIDKATGFFKDTAKSWWSPVADGPNVKLGGAASQLPDMVSTRNVYSNLNTNKSNLADSSNALVTTNNNITKADLGDGSMSDEDRSKLIQWTRGVDVNDQDVDNDRTEARKFLADPLHSVPQLVIYDATTTVQDITIYYGDNQGYIHAVDGRDGKTYFSFMPKELLDNQPALMNSTETASKVYGMDGTVVKWVHDDELNGVLDGQNDFVRIYSGMRRGGRSYYGLDVTNRSAPELMWSITGGVANTDFEELGQTWSKPVKTKVDIGGKLYEALIFGGGYDINQDSVTTRTADSMGRAVYIVDATDGSLLWWAGPTGSGANLEMADMKYSIPASPKVLDVNGDGLADQIYVGDMGGQIFRFDLSNTARLADFATGGRIADLADDTEAGNRRFYHTPDLFGVKIGGARYLGLIIGSGYQANPLNTTIQDRIYMLRIPDVSSAPLDDPNAKNPVVKYSVISESSLYDATENLIQQGTDAEREAAVNGLYGEGVQGWFLNLNNRAGEKVLSESTTVNNEVFVTTYEPKASEDPCLPPTGTARMYHLSVLDGRAVVNYDGVGGDVLTVTDRYVELNTAGLPPKPQRMRVDGTDVVCVGTECRTVNTVQGVVETYWYED